MCISICGSPSVLAQGPLGSIYICIYIYMYIRSLTIAHGSQGVYLGSVGVLVSSWAGDTSV